MKYVLLFSMSDSDDRRYDEVSDAEQRELFQRIADWRAAHSASFLHQGYRLDRGKTATTVRRRNGSYPVTDGPFTGGGEVVGGYTVVEVPDTPAAVAIAKGFPACRRLKFVPCSSEGKFGSAVLWEAFPFVI